MGFVADQFRTLVSMATDSSHRVIMGKTASSRFMSPSRREGGHIVFGADPVGVCVRVASFPCIIF